MATVINPVLLPSIEIKTIKATGIDVYNSNVVETLDNVETRTVGDTKWSISSMTKLNTGGNSKKVIYLEGNGWTYNYNPQTDIASKIVAPVVDSLTFPAMKIKSNDKDVAVCTVRDNVITITSSDSSGALSFNNPWEDSSATIVAVSYRNNVNSSSFCGSILVTNGADYYLLFTSPGMSKSVEVVGITATSEFATYADVENSKVVLVEKLVNGNHIVRQYDKSLGGLVTVSMPTTGYTGKICDPFAVKPLFYGYNSTNLFKVEGTDTAVALLSPAVAGINGIAVFTKFGEDCDAGYIYREAGGTCRDQSGKRTAAITGTMVNDYRYIVCMLNEANVTDVEDPNIET